MFDLSPMQWGGVALVAAGVIWWLFPPAWRLLKAILPNRLPDILPEPEESRLDRMARLAAIQDDLEARGCVEEAKTAGEWYPLLRKEVEP